MFTICKSYDLSAREVIWKKSHTSLRVFRVVGKFREMGKSPQIMGMNQEVIQHLISMFYVQIAFFQTQISCETRVLAILG